MHALRPMFLDFDAAAQYRYYGDENLIKKNNKCSNSIKNVMLFPLAFHQIDFDSVVIGSFKPFYLLVLFIVFGQITTIISAFISLFKSDPKKQK